ncbi:2-nitropropane dioxygenase precursor [Desulfatibacillum alkenivorans DSM 16219]|jgi:nitronate monooxygenase|uniref:2-nitropropane dioxygenase n=1 Tax=Desulfatibacillum alkenivorans DSM 16219 TaxID=1121393 RepID=A0A1M6SRU2_9BACT|nr:nitronate monooxygenase [Desulfatibacillum alkenivorans]SHK47357.1 2-nitropropane dioxygenase precursor [Desulfatibacillum alkenivorans DSM 16219]
MIETKLTKLLGIKYPLVGGTMMWITTADFVAAISNAGGLGVLASAVYQSKEEFEVAVDAIQKKTDKPFAVNINLFPAMRAIDNNEYVDVMIDKGVKIVETSGHSAPEELCKRFKDAGMTWIHKCVGVKYALKVQGMGADVVTVVGYENGGATGRLDIGTMVLVPTVVDAVNLPVIGGGGISDGRGVAAILSLGAEGVIMGTRIMATKECPIHDNLKQAFVGASELDTMLVMRSINATHRVWINDAAKKCHELEENQASFEELYEVIKGDNAKKMYDEGELGAGIVSLGQGVGMTHDVPTVAELFERIMKEAEERLVKLNGQIK